MASNYTCFCGCNNNLVTHWKSLNELPKLKVRECQPEVVEVVEPPRVIIYKGFRYVLEETGEKK